MVHKRTLQFEERKKGDLGKGLAALHLATAPKKVGSDRILFLSVVLQRLSTLTEISSAFSSCLTGVTSGSFDLVDCYHTSICVFVPMRLHNLHKIRLNCSKKNPRDCGTLSCPI